MDFMVVSCLTLLLLNSIIIRKACYRSERENMKLRYVQWCIGPGKGRKRRWDDCNSEWRRNLSLRLASMSRSSDGADARFSTKNISMLQLGRSDDLWS